VSKGSNQVITQA